jgi:hypothetical protein
MFQVITKNEIRQTRDNSTSGTLFYWIEEIAGTLEAINVQSWSELADVGDYYEGECFEIICID